MNSTFKEDIFKNRVAVVTGGTSGIGQATSNFLASLGAKVYALGLKADTVVVPDGLDITPVEIDVTNEKASVEFFAGLEKLDVLFNGAGANFPEQYEINSFKKLMDINANSVFHYSTLAHPLLTKSDIGSIVNVSSMLAIFGSDLGPAYSASKGAVDQITKSLAIAYAKDGIRVNAVAPGWIDTAIVANVPKDYITPIIERTPFKRLGDPDEIAQVAAFLSSPAASFITGAILPIDGGYSII